MLSQHTPGSQKNEALNEPVPQKRSQSTFGNRLADLSSSSEFLVVSKVRQKEEARSLLKSIRSSRNSMPNIREIPHNTYLLKIRYDEEGRPIKRTIVGTKDQYENPQKQREKRGFSLKRLRDEFILKPLNKPQKPKAGKFINAKVTFDPIFGQKKSQSSIVDERYKTISIPRGGDNFKNVYAKKFSNRDLENFINEYKHRKVEEEDISELYSSIFHTSLSSIQSLKNAPKEFLHWQDKDSRFLQNYEKQRKTWRNKAMSLGKKINSRDPRDNLIKKSDAFHEETLVKSGALSPEKNYYKSMNSWYASLRKTNKEDARHSNFIKNSDGKDPIYIHETCHFRDLNIIKRPKELEMFENHNSKSRCLKHMPNTKQSIKAIQRINSVGSLMIKGVNKFDREMEYIKSIPEDKRFIVDNIPEEERNSPSQ
ncbi:unnamed protein product [Moneuplotes crassus]|uniref:Uncharacterized protein n=1 Tax=Euplotes crassus TaxID=5936 RepID=A0AAD1UEY6_EUPCR|nr:unnamed protein product [Moneuplotes crassus]